jgi:phosphoribosylamine--glycine ligase
MKILVVGSGGREHALVWALARDTLKPRLFCAPGNAGTARLAHSVAIPAEPIEGIVQWARENRPHLVVIGPEAPLCAGLTDRLQAEGIRVFGPTREAALLEGSKVFAKDIMRAAGVPTAQAKVFSSPGEAMEYVRLLGGRAVIKVDGLAAGKGVEVCSGPQEAQAAIHRALVEKRFGAAGHRILIEECLEGEEVSVLALVDGERAVLLESAQDHKRLLDGDRGPNTGGMGAYSPAPVLTPEAREKVRQEVFDRILQELRKRGIVYRGVLYAGLMMTESGPKVLEFNCRFGDPEAQALLPRWEGNLIPALEACVEGRLREDMVRWSPKCCVTVVLASRGYPESYSKGYVIRGIEAAEALDDVMVFHAGTIWKDERVLTAGGRVLSVSALGTTLAEAQRRAYLAADRIAFEGAIMRRDIGYRALARCTRPAGI